MEIRKKVYLIAGGSYGNLGNAYIIKHDSGYVMIDSSSPSSLEEIRETLLYWEIPENEITHVLLTHGHDDHAGCAAYFQSKGSKIVVAEEDEYMLKNGNFGVESPYTNHIMPKLSADVLIKHDTIVEIGNLSFNVYKTPGHTNGSVVYYVKVDNDNILFSGDMFFPEGEKGHEASTGWKGDLDYSSEKLGNSFKKLWGMNLDPTIILGGHGIPRLGKNTKDSIMIAYKYYLLNNR